MNKKPLRIIIQGQVPEDLFHSLCDGLEKAMPRCVLLSGDHAFTESHGATVVLVGPDDPVLNQGEAHA